MTAPARTATPERGTSTAPVLGTWPADQQATVRMSTAAAMAAQLGLPGAAGTATPPSVRLDALRLPTTSAAQVSEPADAAPRIDIVLRGDGTGDVLIDGASVASGINVAETQPAIIALALDTAGKAGRPVQMSVVSTDGIHRTLVAPDGSVRELRTDAQPPAGGSPAGVPAVPTNPQMVPGPWRGAEPQAQVPTPTVAPSAVVSTARTVAQPQPAPDMVVQPQLAPAALAPAPVDLPEEPVLPAAPIPHRAVPGSSRPGTRPQVAPAQIAAPWPDLGMVAPLAAPVALAPAPVGPPPEPVPPAEPTPTVPPASTPPSGGVDRGADVVPLTGPAHPQRGVRPPEDGLPARSCPMAPLVVLGAHGGAGESALAALVPGWCAAEHAWPAPAGARQAVVLVARTSLTGLTAARTAATQWAAGQVLHVELVGLVLVADAPGRLPRPLRHLAKVVSGGVPRVWHVPWVEAWRTDPPQLSETPREVRRTVRQLDALTQRGAVGA